MRKFVLIPVVFLFSVGFASACSFTQDADRMQPVEANISKYEHIFVATIVKKQEQEEFAGNEYTFDIQKIYKGGVLKGSQNNNIQVSSPGHSCGSFYEVGQVGLFFMNDITTIDEANPQYFFETKKSALETAETYFPKEKPSVDPRPAVCTTEYLPVCGSRQVQCIKAPCPPIPETFSNKCALDSAGESVTYLYDGVCLSDKKDPTTNLGPQKGPLDGFVEPTTPPPYDNSPEVEVKESKTMVFFARIVDFFRGLFSWR